MMCVTRPPTVVDGRIVIVLQAYAAHELSEPPLAVSDRGPS